MNVMTRAKCMIPTRLPRLLGMKPRAAHVCALNRNIGDNALILAIRQMLGDTLRIQHVEILRNTFNARQTISLRRADILLVGGGGLIHSYGPRGNPLSRSGTLWNIDLDDLKALQKPIVLYGVGFNHFYGDPPPLDRMRELFQVLVDKGALIGMRNDGSRERFLEHFSEFEPHVRTIPDPGIFFRPRPYRSKRPYVVLQIAADRPHLRFGERFEEFIGLIRELLRRVEEEVYLIPHTPDDARLYSELAHDLPVTVWPLKNAAKHTAEVIGLYAGARYTISTRGHSQICSVGNRVPTFAISTHPKVDGFAKTCGLARWCHSFDHTSISDALAAFDAFRSELDAVRRQLDVLNDLFDEQIGEFNSQIRTMAVTGQPLPAVSFLSPAAEQPGR